MTQTVDEQIESMIAAASNTQTAPRVTEQDLKDNITHIDIVQHTTRGGSVLRWAVLTTKNGFAVTGDPSAAVSAANDNQEIGESIAVQNAKHRLWQLMGYALKEMIHSVQVMEEELHG